jgi:hypothetical protein
MPLSVAYVDRTGAAMLTRSGVEVVTALLGFFSRGRL